MRTKSYTVYVPVKEFWLMRVEANSKREAIEKIKSNEFDPVQKSSLAWNESPNGRFELQATGPYWIEDE